MYYLMPPEVASSLERSPTDMASEPDVFILFVVFIVKLEILYQWFHRVPFYISRNLISMFLKVQCPL